MTRLRSRVVVRDRRDEEGCRIDLTWRERRLRHVLMLTAIALWVAVALPALVVVVRDPGRGADSLCQREGPPEDCEWPSAGER